MFRAPVLALTLLALIGLAPVQATTQTVTFSQTVTFNGTTLTVKGTFTVDTTAQTLSGTASVQAVNSMGQTIFSNTFSISLKFGTSNDVTFVLGVPAGSLMLAVSCDVDVTAHSATCMPSKDPDLDRNGVVDILDVATVAFSFGSVQGSPNFNPNADLNGDGTVNIIDVAIAAHDFGSTVFY